MGLHFHENNVKKEKIYTIWINKNYFKHLYKKIGAPLSFQ